MISDPIHFSIPSADKTGQFRKFPHGYRSIIRGPAKRPHSGHSARILVISSNWIIALRYNLPTRVLASQL